MTILCLLIVVALDFIICEPADQGYKSVINPILRSAAVESCLQYLQKDFKDYSTKLEKNSVSVYYKVRGARWSSGLPILGSIIQVPAATEISRLFLPQTFPVGLLS